MSKIYVSDTNIWIDFRNANLLTQLFKLPFAICCTDFVLEELKDFDHEVLLKRGLVVETMDEAATARLFGLMADQNNSSLADVSCYLLAQDTGRPLLTGDGRLRRQATRDGLQVHGALWLLDQLLENHVITEREAEAALQEMLRHGSHLPQSECHSRLLKWGASQR